MSTLIAKDSAMISGYLTNLIDSISFEEGSIREYIGASSIGDPCFRKLWYRFNQFQKEPISSKTQRTFSIGKNLEKLIIQFLRKAGLCIITSEDRPELTALKDKDLAYFQGNIDAIWVRSSKEHIIEIKTAKDASFNVFKKKGLKEWNPQYYAQIQAYMGMSDIYRGYLLALNKDTSELHDEFVAFDEIYYEGLRAKARIVAQSKEAPDRINSSSLFYLCRMCEFNKTCHP